MDLSQLISQLTLDEKILLVSGASTWRTHAVERLAIPSIKVSDGPNGVRGDAGRGSRSTAFPVGVCLAASWNSALIEQLGDAIADEAMQKGVDVVLGPTINLQRTPLGGRNFECYSEDPVLTGRLAVSFIQGLQARGIGACPKHYVCNDSEFERHTISSEVDARTLREVYLRPFEMAVTEGNAWTIMGAYNRVNGVYACSHDELLNGVLRQEWGFDGLVISDWFAAKETVDNANGGLDLEMPGPAIAWGDKLRNAVDAGQVNPAVLDEKVERLLRTALRTGRFNHPVETPEAHDPLPRSASLARQLAAEGMVLVRNNGVLPLADESVRSIALIGPNVATPQVMGGGSSQVNAHHISLPAEALQARYPNAEITYEPGVLTHKYVPPPPPGVLLSETNRDGMTLRSWTGTDATGEPDNTRHISRAAPMLTPLNGGSNPAAQTVEMRGKLQVESSGTWTFGLAAAGFARMFLDDLEIIDNATDRQPGDLFFGAASAERRAELHLVAGQSHELRIEYQSDPATRWQGLRYGVLPPVPADLFDRAVRVARAADVVIAVVGTNLDWETEGNDRENFSLPGDQDLLIRALADANPRTVVVVNSGSPVALPWLEEAPAVLHCWFPGQEFGAALADLVSGDVNPSGRMPVTTPHHLRDTPAFTSYPGEFGKVRYGEGLYLGYRWYDSRAIAPAVPFGHGLSYTQFDYGTPTARDGHIEVAVTNVGARRGQEVVQVYVAPVDSAVDRPAKWLAGFAKVEADPGQSCIANVVMDRRAFDYWDPRRECWITEPGPWRILIGASSRDIRQELRTTTAAVLSP